MQRLSRSHHNADLRLLFGSHAGCVYPNFGFCELEGSRHSLGLHACSVLVSFGFLCICEKKTFEMFLWVFRRVGRRLRRHVVDNETVQKFLIGEREEVQYFPMDAQCDLSFVGPPNLCSKFAASWVSGVQRCLFLFSRRCSSIRRQPSRFLGVSVRGFLPFCRFASRLSHVQSVERLGQDGDLGDAMSSNFPLVHFLAIDVDSCKVSRESLVVCPFVQPFPEFCQCLRVSRTHSQR